MSLHAVPPPNELDAEAAVLSAILLDGGSLTRVREVLEPQHFYADANRRIYESVLSLANKGAVVDELTVAAHLQQKGRLRSVGGSPYIAQLATATPSVAHVEGHAALVVETWRKRVLSDIGTTLAVEARAGADTSELVARTEHALRNITRQTRPAFPTLDASGIFAELEPVSYLIGAIDLCPGAPAMWAGYGYSGKTAAAQSAALAVAANLGKVWGCFAATGGRVLHLDYEQGSRLTRDRYQRLALPMLLGPADLEGRLALVTMPTRYLDQAGAEGDLERLAAGYQLVIIDSLRAAAPMLDENASQVRQVLDMLSRVSERTGAAFLVIHHARKPSANQQGGGKMAIRGSGALFDACGSVLMFEAEKGHPVRVTHEKARSTGVLADDFELVISDVHDGSSSRAGLAVTAGTAPSKEDRAEEVAQERRLARTDRMAVELRQLFLLEPEQGGADAVATRLGRKAKDVREALALLVRSGEVEPTGTTRNRRHRWTGRE